jgi:hypothetical protein
LVARETMRIGLCIEFHVNSGGAWVCYA